MLKELRPALALLVLFTLLTGVIYPFVTTGIASVLFPYQARGSLIERDGKVIGSALIGQNFTEARYFQGRPSATVAADPADPSKTIAAPYNAANTGGSNLGPTSKALIERMTSDVEALKPQNPGVPGADRSRDHVGVRARSGHFPGRRAISGAAGGQGTGAARSPHPRTGRASDRRPDVRHPWRTAGQCAGP